MTSVGYKSRPSRLEPTLDFAERHKSFGSWVTLDNEPKSTPIKFLYLALMT